MTGLKTGVNETIFGYLDDGTEVKLFKLTNENGMVVEVYLNSHIFYFFLLILILKKF